MHNDAVHQTNLEYHHHLYALHPVLLPDLCQTPDHKLVKLQGLINPMKIFIIVKFIITEHKTAPELTLVALIL